MDVSAGSGSDRGVCGLLATTAKQPEAAGQLIRVIIFATDPLRSFALSTAIQPTERETQ